MASPTTDNKALADLIQSYAAREGYKQVDLIRLTKHEKGPIGYLWRGQVARVAPDVLNDVCRLIGLPLRRALHAVGYNIEERVPAIPEDLEEIIPLWPGVPRDVQVQLIQLVHSLSGIEHRPAAPR